MNPNDIHGMALALGLPSAIAQLEAVKLLVAEAVANEREACAKVCDKASAVSLPAFLAMQIRARGNK